MSLHRKRLERRVPRLRGHRDSRRSSMRAFGIAGLSVVLGVVVGTAMQGTAADGDPRMGTPPTRAEPAAPTTVLDAARESLFGDVYVEPTRWRKLRFSTFLTEGWNEPWA